MVVFQDVLMVVKYLLLVQYDRNQEFIKIGIERYADYSFVFDSTHKHFSTQFI